MTTISEMYKRFKGLNLRTEVPIIIEQNSELAIELNQKQLYERSVDKNGNALRLYRSAAYADQKNKMNSQPGFWRPDLYLTGDFYRGFFVKVSKNIFAISSRDSKTKKLVDMYGSDIFGLDNISKEKFREVIVKKGIINYIRFVTKL